MGSGIWGFGYGFSGTGVRVSGVVVGHRSVVGCGLRDAPVVLDERRGSGFGCGDLGVGFRVRGMGFRVSGFVVRLVGCGVRDAPVVLDERESVALRPRRLRTTPQCWKGKSF